MAKGQIVHDSFSVNNFFGIQPVGIRSDPGHVLRWFKEEIMKRRVMIIVLLIAIIAAFYPMPRANADPLTIMAIAGLVTVLSASSVDLVASNYDDDRDQRAQHESSEKLIAKAQESAEASSSR